MAYAGEGHAYIEVDWQNAEGVGDRAWVDATIANGAVSYQLDDSGTAEMKGFQQSADKTKIRILAGLEMLYYAEVGFRLELMDEMGKVVGTQTMATRTVFTSVNALGEVVTAEMLGCQYLAAGILIDVPANESHIICITPYTIAAEGMDPVWGTTQTYTINPTV